MRKRLFFMLAVVPSVCLSVDLYVAPEGDDTNLGTKEKPFATIAGARDAVRTKIAAGLRDTVTVYIRGGTYRITAPIEFKPEDSVPPEGGTSRSVSYAAYGDEKPIISGGRVITGWTVTANGDWTAQIPEVTSGTWTFRQLYVGGRRAQRARHPNSGYFRVQKVGKDRRTNFQFKAGDLRAYRDLDTVELVFIHDWSISRLPVASIDEQTRTLRVKHQIGGASRWAVMDWFEKHPRYFLENSAAFLDEPGEWFLDRATGVLTYRPLPGEAPGTTEVVAPVARQLLLARGHVEGNRPVEGLAFRGLGFEHTAWAPPESVYWGRQACTYWTLKTSDAGRGHEEADPAAVQFEFARGCSLEKIRIAHTGASGVWFGRRCRDNRITDSAIVDAGGNGIMIGEGQTRRVNGRPWREAAPRQAATGHRIANNLVERCGQELFGAVGIWVGLAADTRISRNEVRLLPYTGISVGWMWWNPRARPEPRPTPCAQTTIVDNHIHHVMLTLSDGGGIYSLGSQPGSIIRGNLIHDIPANVGRAESNGMFLDQGTGEFLIEQNTIYNVHRSPLRFHKGWKNTVRGNVLHVRPGVPPVRYNDTKEERIQLVDNTIVKEVSKEILQKARQRIR